MIEESVQLPMGASLSCDICIVGSGAAGISMALRLIASGLNVVVLEAGLERFDSSIQEFYEGEVANGHLHPPASKFRQRRFGGSTGIWSGCCIPFDPLDFENRPQLSESGWPIAYPVPRPIGQN